MDHAKSRKLTSEEAAEYSARCAELTQRHLTAYRALLEELGIKIVDGEARKIDILPAPPRGDNYNLAV